MQNITEKWRMELNRLMIETELKRHAVASGNLLAKSGAPRVNPEHASTINQAIELGGSKDNADAVIDSKWHPLVDHHCKGHRW